MKAVVETITPEMAAEYLEFNVINRPLNKKHVDFLARQMKNGEWKLNGEAICFEGQALVNGQHRLNAVIQAGIPVSFLVVRGCEKDSFITYDSGRNRSNSDVFNLENIPNASKVSSIVTKYFSIMNGWTSLSTSVTRAPGLSGNCKKSKSEILKEYYSSPELYQHAARLSKSCTRKIRLLSEAEAGGLFVYLVKYREHDKDFVESFFRMLFFDENVSNETIHSFREKVIQDRLSNRVMSSSYKQALLAKTWNNYVNGTESKRLSWNEFKEGNISFI